MGLSNLTGIFLVLVERKGNGWCFVFQQRKTVLVLEYCKQVILCCYLQFDLK